jgi:hypothetical protein
MQHQSGRRCRRKYQRPPFLLSLMPVVRVIGLGTMCGSVALLAATTPPCRRDGGSTSMHVFTPAPYQVEAFNTSKASENKIHDDAVARRFGFSGGLVPGVDVYGYMTHQPVARWGRAWLERGVGPR